MNNQPNRLRHVSSIWIIVLEIFAGVLFLGCAMLLVGFWWIQQPSSQETLNGWVNQYAEKHMPEGWSVSFARSQFDFTLDPFDIFIVLDEVSLEGQQVQTEIPRVAAHFGVKDLWALSFAPYQISVEGAKIALSAEDAAETASAPNPNVEQLALLPLLWLSNDSRSLAESHLDTAYRQDLETLIGWLHTLRQVELKDFELSQDRAGVSSQLLGTVRLLNQPDHHVSVDVVVSDSRFRQQLIPVSVVLSQVSEDGQERLNIAAISSLSAELLAYFPLADGVLSDWLASLGAQGKLTLDSQIVADQLLAMLNPDLNSLDALMPMVGTAQLNWPKDQPTVQLTLNKPSMKQSTLLIEAQTFGTIMPPAILGHQLPELSAVEAKLTSTLAFDEFEDMRVTMAGEKGEKLSLEGRINLNLWPVELTLTAENVPTFWLPPHLLPADVPPFDALIHQLTATLNTQQTGVELAAKAELHDVYLAYEQQQITLPKLQLTLDQGAIVAKSLEAFPYQDIDILAAELNGSFAEGFTGTIRANIPEITALSLIQDKVPPALPLSITQPVEIASTFHLNSDGDLNIEQIRALSPMKGDVWQKPLIIDTLDVKLQPLNVTASGTFNGQPTIVQNQYLPEGMRIDASLSGLSVALLRDILGYYPVDSDWLDEEITSEGDFDLAVSLLMDPADNSLKEASLKTDVRRLRLVSKPYGEVIAPSPKNTLIASLRFADHLALDLEVSVPIFQGKAEAKFDWAKQQLLSFESQDWRFEDYPFDLSMQRSDQGMAFRLKAPDGKWAVKIIEILVSDTITPLPKFMLPLTYLEWSAPEMLLDQKKYLRPVLMVKLLEPPADDPTMMPNKSLLDRFFLRLWSADTETPPENTQKPAKLRGHLINFHPLNFLKIESENMGLLLSTLKITDALRGGETAINMEPTGEDFAGDIVMKDFVVTRTNALVALLEAISVTGLISLLTSDGIPFAILNAEVTKEKEHWYIREMKTFGPGLSLTYSGDLNTKTGAVNGKGTVSPTSILNNVIGAIPIVGTLLTGTDSGGLIAADFTLSGTLQEPELDSQPLSLLQPGILRNIFGEVGSALSGDN